MANEFESIVDRLKSKVDGKSFQKTGPNTFRRITYPESGIKKVEYVSKGNPNIKGKEKGRVTEKFKPYISRKTKGKQKSYSVKPVDTIEEARKELKKLQKKYPRQDLIRPRGLESTRGKPALDRMAELLFLADAKDDIRPLANLSIRDAANIGYFTGRQDNMEYLSKKSGLSVDEIFDLFDDREAYIDLEKNPDARAKAVQTVYGDRINFYRKAEKWLLRNAKRYSDPEKFKKAFNRTFGKNNIFNKLLNSDKTQLNLQFSDSFKKEFLGVHELRDNFGRVKGIKPDSDIIKYSIHKKSANDIFKTVLYNLNPSVRNKLLNEFKKAIPKTKPKAKDLYEIREFIRNNKLFKQYGVDRAIRGPIARLLYKDLGEETLKEISELRKKKLGTASLLRVLKDKVNPKYRKAFSEALSAVDSATKGSIPEAKQKLKIADNINFDHRIPKSLVEAGYADEINLIKLNPTLETFNVAIKNVEYDRPMLNLARKYELAPTKEKSKIMGEMQDLQSNFNKKYKNYLGDVTIKDVKGKPFFESPDQPITKKTDLPVLLEKNIKEQLKIPQVAKTNKEIAEGLRAAGFKCKYSAQSGGLARCDDPMNYIDDIKRNQRLAIKGSPQAKARAFGKFRAAKSVISGFLGPAAIAFEAAVAAPFALSDFAAGAESPEIISNLTFGLAGQSQDERMKEKYGENIFASREFLEKGDRLDALSRLQGGTKGQRIRSKTKYETLKPEFESLGKKVGYLDEQGSVTEEGAKKYVEDALNLQNKEIQEQMIKGERAKERQEKYGLTGLEIPEMRDGGLMNLTRTVAPQSGPNSKGLESIRKYATKRY